MSITAEAIVELFEKDVKARKRLAELLVIEPDVRLAIINAVLRDVATKNDIERLRITTREELEKLKLSTKEDIEKLRIVTKEDIERLRAITREDIEKLRGEIIGRIVNLEGRLSSLEGKIAKLEGQTSLFIKLFIAFNLPILLGIIGVLLKMIFP